MAITIDGKEYEIEDFNDNARAQLASMQLADQKIAQLQSEIAMAQTARNAYAQALAAELSDLDDDAEKCSARYSLSPGALAPSRLGYFHIYSLKF